MNSILQGLPHVICYLDDILVNGVTEKEHLQNLEEVLHRLKESGVTLMMEKCSFINEKYKPSAHCACTVPLIDGLGQEYAYTRIHASSSRRV